MIHHSDETSAGPLETEKAEVPKKSSNRLTIAQARDFGLTAPNQSGKNFVLDTNVLLHDPGCLGRFMDNHICVPVDVLAELDRFKNEQTDRGANARAVHRKLSEMFASADGLTSGVTTKGGGSLRLVVYEPKGSEVSSQQLRKFHRIFPDRERVDHRILACALLLAQHNKTPVVLVTKDLNMQLKARAVGIEVQDYLNDKVDPREVSDYDLRRIDVDPAELQRFASGGELEMESERRMEVVLNQYVLLQVSEKQTMPARLDANGTFMRLAIPEALRIPDGNSLKPLNLGQKCLVDALLNPDLSLVTCYGQAGTGKTLVAIAAGLHEVFGRRYNGMTVSRPVVRTSSKYSICYSM